MNRRLPRASVPQHPLLVLAFVVFANALAACRPSGGQHGGAASTSCAACHLAEYRSAPHHVNERPTQCQVCHRSTAWTPTILDHRWPLTGAHQHTRCFDCHRGNPPVFQGTPSACVDCHRADFDRSTFPGHASFPTTCASCHSTVAWAPAISNPEVPAEPAAVNDAGVSSPATAHRHHAQVGHAAASPDAGPIESPPVEPVARQHPEQSFPIRTGHHAGIGCTTCHDQGGTMGRDDTDCVQCHPRSRYDGIHVGVDGYPSGRAALNFCVECHRRGTRARD